MPRTTKIDDACRASLRASCLVVHDEGPALYGSVRRNSGNEHMPDMGRHVAQFLATASGRYVWSLLASRGNCSVKVTEEAFCWTFTALAGNIWLAGPGFHQPFVLMTSSHARRYHTGSGQKGIKHRRWPNGQRIRT